MKPRDRILELLNAARVPLSASAISRICWIGSWRLYPELAKLERDCIVTSEFGEPTLKFGAGRPRLYSLTRRCDKPRPPDAIVKARWCPEPEEDAKFHRRVSENIISGHPIVIWDESVHEAFVRLTSGLISGVPRS
jgi:hypothetical protein